MSTESAVRRAFGAASSFFATHFSARETHLQCSITTLPKSVEMSLDAADRSVCATSYKSILLLLACALLIRADLSPTVQHLSSSQVISALFRSVPMPGGAVPILRPPAQTRPALTSLITASPRDAELYRLRAQQAETALDFPAAEADWKLAAQHAPDRYDSQIELADFYHRRDRPRDELAALTTAAETKDDPLQPATAQRGWQAFERMAALLGSEALPQPIAEPVFRAWVARYPKEPLAWQKLIEFLATSRQYAAAEAEIAAYGRTFHDTTEPVRMRAELALHRGDANVAIATYDAAFQPLWPDEMRASFFKLLQEQGRLRDFTAKARTALASNPADLDASARLFHYFRSQGNVAAARRVLLEYRIAKESGRQPWTPDELQTAAQLFEMLPDVNEAARLYYALYSAPAAGGPHTERALYGLAKLLLTASDQPIQFGAGDLSFYKDIATVDPSPGFFNGILSLLLNWSGAREEYRNQSEKSAAYFHRAAANRLVTLLDQRFPRSEYRPTLHSELVSAYATYGDDESVIRAAREYLAEFPNGGARVAVAMQAAGALARGNRTDEEFALYDQLLKELAAKASGVPIGTNPPSPPPPSPNFQQVDNPDAPTPPAPGVRRLRFGVSAAAPHPTGPRSAEYSQVLDRYLSRLVAVGTPVDALRVYRTEIDRNPNDQGLYERMAAFVEQYGVGRAAEAVYTQAIAKFPNRNWYHKLARWYLRHQERQSFEKITRDVVAIFSGSELERYFAEFVPAHPDESLYLQLNLYAHQRFPEDLVFVHNLLNAYGNQQTLDRAAADRLLRQYWFYDDGLRSSLFEELSSSGQLDAELSQVRATNPGVTNGHYEQALAANPAAVQFVAEAEAWLSHFESAAPAERALANAYPGRSEFTGKATTLYRSLAAFDPRNTDLALAMAADEHKAAPRDTAILAKMGDILADRELFTRARTYWEQMPAAEPGRPEAWLDTATVYWDYYQFNDALRWIAGARKKFGDSALFAYQAGAIDENKRDFAGAVREYVAGALDGDNPSSSRLLRLLSSPQSHDLVDRATAAAAASHPSPESVKLRISVLEAGQRRAELESFLTARVEAEQSPTELTNLQETARRLGFDGIEARASERMIPITNDPVDKMRLALANVRLHESKKQIADAGRLVDALYRDHPLILGVVRGAVDFHVRNGQHGEAIGELLDASSHAQAQLAAQFKLEAARVATDAGQYDRARSLLDELLASDPLRTEYLTAVADTYLRAKDDAGFRDYQLATIQRLQQASLSPAERVERIAAIRRSLIPAFDRLKDYAGAMDQYIEVLNRFAEDESIAKEAATYGVAHGQAARLVAFYRKTTNDSPLDYRWPIVLGRIETVTEDFPAAIADYERGIKARPDRADVLEAKARLEERLMRFDDAIRSYGRLYELTYRNPQWMTKVAELRARTGQTREAVTALKTAIIGARTESAAADFEIAEQLEAWHIIPDAVAFAERGASLSGAQFEASGDVQRYGRILARGRRLDEVLQHIGPTDGVDMRLAPAGNVVAETYTPEEKAQVEQMLITEGTRIGPKDGRAHLLTLVQSAGLVDLEARWYRESMTEADHQRLVPLEVRRGRFRELARALEDFAAKNSGNSEESRALIEAINAYIAEGDIENQMRLMRQVAARNDLVGPLLDRYLNLLIARQPDELVAMARGNTTALVKNRSVQLAIASGRTDLADRAIQARGGSLPPVWSRAYTALSGLYLSDRAASVDAAFQSALDTRSIGERLRSPIKPDSVIVGRVWFYYAARYADYLGKNSEAAGWLPAYVEANSGNPEAYMELGDCYADAGKGAKAIEEYEAALQLDADRADAHDHAARVLWAEGRQAEAIARWKTALGTYLKIQSRGVRVPDSFWQRADATFTALGERHALGQLRPEISHLLGDYYQRNNRYRFDELLRAAARASVASGDGLDWLVELTRSMEYPDGLLYALTSVPGITDAQRIELQRYRLALVIKEAQSQFGDAQSYAVQQVNDNRVQLVSMLLNSGDVAAATAEWRLLPLLPQLPPGRWAGENNLYYETEIRLASRSNSLSALLARYGAESDFLPAAEALRLAAAKLRDDHDENGARAVLEFVYERGIRAGHLDASNFIGLAEVELQRGDTAAALPLLNRMALVVGDGFETLTPAGDLLTQYQKNAEAADFFKRRIKAVPWDSAAKVRLAHVLPNTDAERQRLLAETIGDSQAAYKLRAEAARLSVGNAAKAPAGTELALLSAPSVTPDAASKPFQVEARVEAARQTFDTAIRFRLWQEALAIAPEDERVRAGTLRAAIVAGHDNFALALEPAAEPLQADAYNPERRQISSDERASIAEAVAGAAERLDDLPAAIKYLHVAIDLRPRDQRDPLMRKLNMLTVEQNRRTKNLARQPAVRDVIEQDGIVRPQILGGAR
ncbi:MAG TPA: hypothetical protein VKU19_38730 [Bryobacteraceae bacterium]|nr:hypothetical protein [Bryobacteraceae bacterium]